MLTRFIWRTFYVLSNQKIIDQNQDPSSSTTIRKKKNYEFKIKLSKINDPNYLMELINHKHSLKQTNRFLGGIIRGVGGINSRNFENIFKKYSYYIQQIPKGESYSKASTQQKLGFLNGVTEVYARLGRLAGNHMIKSYNKVSDDVYNLLKQQLDNQNIAQSQKQQVLAQLVQTILCVSRYNKNKAYALFMSIQKRLINPKLLLKINILCALSYLQLMPLIKIYNRLIIQTCVDVLKDQIQYMNYNDAIKVAYCLATSHYPINKKFVVKLIKRVDKELDKQIDPTSGQAYAKNEFSLRHNLKVLSALSMIEVNMNLSSAYLPDLDSLFQLQLQDLGTKYINMMPDKDLQVYCSFLRRASYFDQTLLQALTYEILDRKVKQVKQLDKQMTGVDQFDQKYQNYRHKQSRLISLNTICAALHTLAIYSYRHQGLINYFIKVVQLLTKAQKTLSSQTTNKLLKDDQNQIIKKNQKNPNPNEVTNNFSKLIHPKYYSRVVWSLCVLGTKEQLAQIYPIFEEFFLQQYKDQKIRPGIHEMLNFYYCYLLLKSYFPKNTISFDRLMEELEQNSLLSSISKTHEQLFQEFISAGIPALKQHNISNLMCDVFIPKYTSRNGLFQVNNVIIDLHGPHHSMRNCDRIKGGSQLKKKILVSQGYIYQYIAVHQWELVSNKSNYLILLMESIIKKFGSRVKIHDSPKLTKHSQFKNKSSPNQKQIIQHKQQQKQQQYQQQPSPSSQTTSKINYEKKGGRRIKTNNLSLQNKLNKKQNKM